jgi:ABC-type sugar transport system ATPase subunit
MTRPVTATPILDASGVSKMFGPVVALRDASLRVGRGEIVALMGANGAGKSTFVKILTGSSASTGATASSPRPPLRGAADWCRSIRNPR